MFPSASTGSQRGQHLSSTCVSYEERDTCVTRCHTRTTRRRIHVLRPCFLSVPTGSQRGEHLSSPRDRRRVLRKHGYCVIISTHTHTHTHTRTTHLGQGRAQTQLEQPQPHNTCYNITLGAPRVARQALKRQDGPWRQRAGRLLMCTPKSPAAVDWRPPARVSGLEFS